MMTMPVLVLVSNNIRYTLSSLRREIREHERIRTTSNLGVGVLRQARIENSVRNLITDLV